MAWLTRYPTDHAGLAILSLNECLRLLGSVSVGRIGFTAGDIGATIPRFTPHNRAANQALVEPVAVLAQAKSVTLEQVALAWLLARALMDRADPRHQAASTTARERRRDRGGPARRRGH
jgi:hypothetical protein